MPKQKKVHVAPISRDDTEGTPPEPYVILDELLAEEHADLAELNFQLYWHYGWKADGDKHGYKTYAKTKILSPAHRIKHGYDVDIFLNFSWWQDVLTNFEQKKYVLDDALAGVGVESDENNDQARDEQGKLVLKRVKPFVSIHREVLQRRGAVMPEVRSVQAVFNLIRVSESL